MSNGVTAWSFSRLELWERCPFAFKCKHIDKLPDPGSPAMARGNSIHKEAALFLNGTTSTLAPELMKFADEMRELKTLKPFVEQQWALSSRWRKTGWFDKLAWCRVILDAGVVYDDGTADVIDHKTGKKYGENVDQMNLFATATFAWFPTVEHVTTRLWYLDADDEDIAEYDRDQFEDLKAEWEDRVAPMFNDTIFAPRPNEKCRWCAYAKSKGGPCKFG